MLRRFKAELIACCRRLTMKVPMVSPQKHWIPRYTRAGFKKTRAPPLLFALLKVRGVLAATTAAARFPASPQTELTLSTLILGCVTLQEFFEKHKNNSVIENWTDDNIYVNHEQSRQVSYLCESLARCLIVAPSLHSD